MFDYSRYGNSFNKKVYLEKFINTVPICRFCHFKEYIKNKIKFLKTTRLKESEKKKFWL